MDATFVLPSRETQPHWSTTGGLEEEIDTSLLLLYFEWMLWTHYFVVMVMS